MTDSPTHRLRTLLAKLRRVVASQLNARGLHNAGGLPPCVPIYLFDFFLKIKKRLPTPLIFSGSRSLNLRKHLSDGSRRPIRVGHPTLGQSLRVLRKRSSHRAHYTPPFLLISVFD